MSHRAIVLAPHGRDANVAGELLLAVGVTIQPCADLAVFEKALADDVAFALVTDETLRTADLRGVADWFANQPAWSDLPVIILTRHGGGPERNPTAARLTEVFGNAFFLERPFHPTTFVSAARSALKARRRQFDVRARVEELHESEDRLRTALLAGRLGAWELDLATQTLTASDTYKALFGRTPEQSLSYGELVASVHPEDRERMQDSMRRCVSTSEDYAVEYRIVRPDGAVRWAEIRARLAADRAARPSRLVGVSADITERKMAEESLLRLNETLEERVAARTAELEIAHHNMLEEIAQRVEAEEQLRQSQKMEMIGQLTGGVAHDFNNLLMAVIGNLDLLRKHIPEDAKSARLIDGAIQGAQRGAALTQRLLAFARRQELTVEPVEMTALVTGMTDLVERSIGSAIELRFELPDEPLVALADANQVELALLNLVVNARDAMPGGGGLTICVDEVSPGPGDELSGRTYIRLAVIDTGHGMDKETLAKATEPFFSTKGVGKGTGLGLSMIHGLALQLDGAFRLSSEPGAGTRAELWLPATAKAPKAVGGNEPARQPSEEAARAGLKILVVDDDALISMSTVDMLEDLGHQAIEAGSGAVALDILGRDRDIELMITDFSMPRMNGAQLARAARDLRPDLPILLATGYAELPEGEELSLPRLSKPYHQGQLAREIIKLTRETAGAAS